jgi:ribose-phosphate pyrophosphokinase
VKSALLFPLPGNEDIARRIAALVGGEVAQLETRSFPDGEQYVRVLSNVEQREAVIVCTLRQPTESFLPLAFLADALHDLGAPRVGLVAPYLAYMRQDTRFSTGEAVTSQTFADLISSRIDWLVTVDPHLHRLTTLSDIYSIPAMAAHAAEDLGRWIAENVESPFIIGPDAESAQWVNDIARAASAPSTVLTKVRRGDMDVVESIPDLEGNRHRSPVLVDDIISTGRTMLAAITHLNEQGARPASCVAVHAVFAADAYVALRDAGAARIATTNTIPHPSNAIDATRLIADQVRALLVAR